MVRRERLSDSVRLQDERAARPAAFRTQAAQRWHDFTPKNSAAAASLASAGTTCSRAQRNTADVAVNTGAQASKSLCGGSVVNTRRATAEWYAGLLHAELPRLASAEFASSTRQPLHFSSHHPGSLRGVRWRPNLSSAITAAQRLRPLDVVVSDTLRSCSWPSALSPTKPLTRAHAH